MAMCHAVLQVAFVEACVTLDRLKPAARAVRQLRLAAEFPNIEGLYRQRSLGRLMSKRLWPVALSYVGNDVTLQVGHLGHSWCTWCSWCRANSAASATREASAIDAASATIAACNAWLAADDCIDHKQRHSQYVAQQCDEGAVRVVLQDCWLTQVYVHVSAGACRPSLCKAWQR